MLHNSEKAFAEWSVAIFRSRGVPDISLIQLSHRNIGVFVKSVVTEE